MTFLIWHTIIALLIHTIMDCLRFMLLKIKDFRQVQKCCYGSIFVLISWGFISEGSILFGCYIADFVCLKKKIIIEVDGGYHSQDAQIVKDYYRTEDLNKLGFVVLRFKNEELFSNISFVLDTIFNELARPS